MYEETGPGIDCEKEQNEIVNVKECTVVASLFNFDRKEDRLYRNFSKCTHKLQKDRQGYRGVYYSFDDDPVLDNFRKGPYSKLCKTPCKSSD